jgi:hypothetical protein
VNRRFGIRSAVIASSLVLLVAATGCKELNPFDPCPETKVQENAGQLDGTWDAVFVRTQLKDGPLPYQPFTGAPVLEQGSLLFQTTSAVKGSSCAELLKTEGIVMATYRYETAGLFTKKISDWNGGRFVFDHKTEVLTLRAGKESKEINVTTADGERAIVASVSAADFKVDWAAKLGLVTTIFTKRERAF